MKSLKKFSVVVAILLLLLAVAGCNESESPIHNTDSSHSTNDKSNNTNTDVVDTGIVLSNDLMDFTIRIDHAVYKLPMDLTAFEKNGWSLPDYFDGTKKLYSDHYASTKLEKNGEKLEVELINKTGDAQNAGDCPVGRISYYFPGSTDIYLAGNFHLNNATLEQVIAQYGEPFSNETYGDYTYVKYEKADSFSIYEGYTFTFDAATGAITEFTVVNFVAAETPAVSGAANTDYLSGYSAPTTLGSDPASFHVSLLGELYALPAPVSAFLANGWELQSSDAIGAGTYNDNILLSKNGQTFVFGAFNFADKLADVKDCTIYKVTESAYDNIGLDLMIPGNVKIGSSAAEAEKALSGLDKSESAGGSITYAINTSGQMVSVYVFADTQEVTSITVINRIWNHS